MELFQLIIYNIYQSKLHSLHTINESDQHFGIKLNLGVMTRGSQGYTTNSQYKILRTSEGCSFYLSFLECTALEFKTQKLAGQIMKHSLFVLWQTQQWQRFDKKNKTERKHGLLFFQIYVPTAKGSTFN